MCSTSEPLLIGFSEQLLPEVCFGKQFHETQYNGKIWQLKTLSTVQTRMQHSTHKKTKTNINGQIYNNNVNKNGTYPLPKSLEHYIES